MNAGVIVGIVTGSIVALVLLLAAIAPFVLDMVLRYIIQQTPPDGRPPRARDVYLGPHLLEKDVQTRWDLSNARGLDNIVYNRASDRFIPILPKMYGKEYRYTLDTSDPSRIVVKLSPPTMTKPWWNQDRVSAISQELMEGHALGLDLFASSFRQPSENENASDVDLPSKIASVVNQPPKKKKEPEEPEEPEFEIYNISFADPKESPSLLTTRVYQGDPEANTIWKYFTGATDDMPKPRIPTFHPPTKHHTKKRRRAASRRT